MSAKATHALEVTRFEDIPNIGKKMAEDFREMGLKKPSDLMHKDAFALYQKRCRQTGVRQDPCVLDTYIAAIDFLNGAPARPWFAYTAQRKRDYPDL